MLSFEVSSSFLSFGPDNSKYLILRFAEYKNDLNLGQNEKNN